MAKAFRWLLALVALLPLVSVLPAAAVDVDTLQAHAWENVYQDGDMLIITSYELPLAGWQNSTYMADDTCADEDDIEDACYTSLLPGAASLTLYDDAGDLVASRPIPRINFGIAANYLCAQGSSTCQGQNASVITFGSALVLSCVSPPAGTPGENCVGVQWHDTTSTTLEESIRGAVGDMLTNIEHEMSLPQGSLINQDGAATLAGAVFPIEAFVLLPQIAPSLFQLSTQAGGIAVGAIPTPNPVTGAVAQGNTAAAGNLRTSMNSFGTLIGLGNTTMAGWIFGAMFTLLGAAVIYVAALMFVRTAAQQAVGLGAAYLVCMVGYTLGWLHPTILFGATALLVLFGLPRLVGKGIPQ